MNPNLSSLPVKASIIIWILCCSCKPVSRRDLSATIAQDGHEPAPKDPIDSSGYGINPYPAIGAIPLPAGYRRVTTGKGSFADWLRNVTLKKDRTVRLYDGTPRSDQGSQYAVLDISVGKTDLQQCADAVMRLRAEYLYSRQDNKDIEFHTGQGTSLNFGEWAAGQRWKIDGGRLMGYRAGACEDRKCFWDYLRIVFTYCGTLTLEQQLRPVARIGEMRIGDVFIHGGSPGHAMLVVDMAEDSAGRKIFLLAQGFMPAQDIHIVRNFNNSTLTPWYSVDYDQPVYTPGYIFYPGQLRTWPSIANDE
jgi:hypothetical protein